MTRGTSIRARKEGDLSRPSVKPFKTPGYVQVYSVALAALIGVRVGPDHCATKPAECVTVFLTSVRVHETGGTQDWRSWGQNWRASAILCPMKKLNERSWLGADRERE